MPIKTPESFIENYRDGVEHFEHVLKCLWSDPELCTNHD